MKKYMGNYTNEAAKALKGSERIICRVTDDGAIYVTNGFIAYKMNPPEYAAIVQPVTCCEAGNYTMPATVNSYPWPPAPPPLASGTADTWPPSISFPPTKRCVTSPDAKFAPTVSVSPVFCPSPAGRNCLTVNLQPSAPLTIYSMAAPVPLLPPMISPSAII